LRPVAAEPQAVQQWGAGCGNLRRLPQDAVARGERLDDLHAVEEQWVIPGTDDADDAVRPAVDGVTLAEQPQRPVAQAHLPRPQQRPGLALQEAAGVGERQHVAAEHFVGRAADLVVDGLGQLVAGFDEQVPEGARGAQPLAHRAAGPILLCPAAGGDLFREIRSGRGVHGGYSTWRSPW
jgi:hypothetical protein